MDRQVDDEVGRIVAADVEEAKATRVANREVKALLTRRRASVDEIAMNAEIVEGCVRDVIFMTPLTTQTLQQTINKSLGLWTTYQGKINVGLGVPGGGGRGEHYFLRSSG